MCLGFGSGAARCSKVGEDEMKRSGAEKWRKRAQSHQVQMSAHAWSRSHFICWHSIDKKIVADLQYVGQRIVQVTVCLFWDDYLDPLHLAAYYDTCISVWEGYEEGPIVCWLFVYKRKKETSKISVHTWTLMVTIVGEQSKKGYRSDNPMWFNTCFLQHGVIRSCTHAHILLQM